MANLVNLLWKEAVIQGASDSSLAGDIKIVFIDTGAYTYDVAHDFLDDVPVGARITTSGNLTGKTFVNGTFDADDITIAAVSGTTIESAWLIIDTTVDSTSRLVAYLDTVTGLPVTPNGSDIQIRWNAGGIFTL